MTALPIACLGWLPPQRKAASRIQRAKGIIGSHVEALHKVAEALLERESLDGAEIDELLRSCAVTPTPGDPAAATA